VNTFQGRKWGLAPFWETYSYFEPVKSLYCALLLEDDYFDAASGAWDLDGLKDDLRLAKALGMKLHILPAQSHTAWIHGVPIVFEGMSMLTLISDVSYMTRSAVSQCKRSSVLHSNIVRHRVPMTALTGNRRSNWMELLNLCVSRDGSKSRLLQVPKPHKWRNLSSLRVIPFFQSC